MISGCWQLLDPWQCMGGEWIKERAGWVLGALHMEVGANGRKEKVIFLRGNYSVLLRMEDHLLVLINFHGSQSILHN